MISADTLMIWGLGAGLSALATLPVLRRLWREEETTAQAVVKALEYGLNEPASLHPVVDPGLCIGTGSCVDVCPEGKVLGIRAGQAIAIAPASCIGHGLCERSCPMDAIQLVFGTRRRGVDIPRISETFETNVPGIYIVGELGGMGLIRNAFEQGRQCIEGIAKLPRHQDEEMLDLVIVGAGPAGLASSLHAQEAGLRFVTLDKEADLGGTVRHYPRKKLVMTAPVVVPGFGRIGGHEIRKEELMEVWARVAREAELPIVSDQTVRSVTRDGEAFRVLTHSGDAYLATRVILAIGRRGIPRKLGVPGEALPKVSYALAEPEAYEGDRIVVVGGGDSAIEAAMALSEARETKVAVSYRRDRFNRIKPGNRERVEAAIAAGQLDVHWSTSVRSIEPDRIWLSSDSNDAYPLENDQLFVFAGGELPTGFLRECGVEIDTKFGTP